MPLSPAQRAARRTSRAIAFLSFFDRFSAAPLLVVFAAQEKVSVADAAALLAAYSFAYALGQPAWGTLGDRLGRLPTLRLSLAGAIVAGAMSVILTPVPAVFAARIVTGLCVGGLFPTLMTITGDTTAAGAERGREVSALQTASALGTTVATLAAAAVATVTNWRVVVAATVVGFAVALWALHGRRDPVPDGAAAPRDVRAAFGRWPLALYAIGFADGAILLGVLSFIAPAITAAGAPPALAGVLAASYGVAIIVGAQLNRRLVRHWPRSRIIAVGGAALVLAYALAATGSIAALTAAAVLVGLSNALFHASVQAWATEIAPTARATTVSLFVFSLFVGAAAATSAIAAFVDHGLTPVFLVAALAALALTAATTAASRIAGAGRDREA